MAMHRLPGLIDIHVHLRDPGATYKEDFGTGTRAAIHGGFTYIIDMPNNPGDPTVSLLRLKEKIDLAHKKALCDVGFHYGTDGHNLETFPQAFHNPDVFGLKIYEEPTTGELLIENYRTLEDIMSAWNNDKPILVHAEGARLEKSLAIAHRFGRRLHVCHVSSAADVKLVREAKARNQYVTAGVTPHHLFLTDVDVARLGNFGLVKPAIADKKNQDALWEALADRTIDIVETDHAPHTKEEKARSAPSFGVPGLETAVGLLLRAVKEKRLSDRDVVILLHNNPQKIFAIPDQKDTFVELDPDTPYKIGEGGYETKCGWSPFDGWEAYGKVQRVVLRGKSLVENGKIV